MKHLFGWLLIFIVSVSCEQQNKTGVDEENKKSVTKDAVISYGPSSVVRTIKQDRNGHIWMTSWEGIFRYDGRSFTNITSEITSARFFSLLEDRNGNFWFGTIGSGVYFYDGSTFQNFTTTEGLISNEIGYIYEDRAGNIWFGGSGGASRYNGRSFTNYVINGTAMKEDKTGKTFSERQSSSVNSILQDRNGMYWFATTSDTFIYDGKAFSTCTDHGKSFKNLFSMIEDRKGNIWLGGTCYDGNTFTKLTQQPILCIYEDRAGNIWTSSSSGSSETNWILSRYEPNSIGTPGPTVTLIEPKLGAVFTILEAYDGSIWLGADGAYRFDGKTFHDFISKQLNK